MEGSMVPTLTHEEESKLLKALADEINTTREHKRYKAVRDLVLILLGLRCGLRVGESQRLTVSMVWLKDEPVKSIHIPLGFNKNCLDAWIPVPPELTSALWIYVPTRLHHAAPIETDPLLLVSQPGKIPRNPMMTRPVVSQTMKHWAEKANIRRFKYHSLRHTYATRFVQQGTAHIRTIQQLLRHRSISSTQLYTHPTQDDAVIAVMKTFPGIADPPVLKI